MNQTETRFARVAPLQNGFCRSKTPPGFGFASPAVMFGQGARSEFALHIKQTQEEQRPVRGLTTKHTSWFREVWVQPGRFAEPDFGVLFGHGMVGTTFYTEKWEVSLRIRSPFADFGRMVKMRGSKIGKKCPHMQVKGILFGVQGHRNVVFGDFFPGTTWLRRDMGTWYGVQDGQDASR